MSPQDQLTLVKGLPVGKDGRIHPTLSQNPSTLRFACANPNLQNIPRAAAGTFGRYVKDFIVAPEGRCLVELDFQAIEAVLVGYFAGSARYVKAAKLGVHAFLASHLIGEPAEFSWDEDRLKAYFKWIKRNHDTEYQTAKRVIHGSNFRGSPKRIQELFPEMFATIKDAARLQGMYFDLFPEIPTWHRELCLRVDAARSRRQDASQGPPDPWTLGVSYAQNPFGYVHRFYNVLDWEKVGDEWVWSLGEDAKRLIAFLPQSTAAGIIKRAMRTLYEEFPWVGELMILTIHDSLLFEGREDQVGMIREVAEAVMTLPIPELPLDPSWEMGDCLSIGVETKIGRVWSEME